MKGKIFKKLLFLFCLGFMKSVVAYEIVCPELATIKAATPELKIVPQNWEVSEYQDTLLRLDGAGIYSGKPVYLAQLKPKSMVINGKKYYPAWEVGSKLDLNNEGFWLSCSYNHNQVQLTRRIDSAMKVCWTVYSKNQQGGLLAKLQCQ